MTVDSGGGQPQTTSDKGGPAQFAKLSDGCGTVGSDKMSNVEASDKLNGNGEMSEEPGNVMKEPSNLLSIGSASCFEEEKGGEEDAPIKNERPQSDEHQGLDSDQVQQSTGTSNLVIEKAQQPNVTSDSVVENGQQSSVTSDLVVEKAQQPNVTSDSVIEKAQQPNVTSDSVVKKAQQSPVTSDSVVEKAQQSTVTSDYVIGKAQQSTVTSDSVIEKAQQSMVTSDSVIEKAQQSDSDRAIEKALSGPGSLNGGLSIQQAPPTILAISSRDETKLDDGEPLLASSDQFVNTAFTETDPSNAEGLSDITQPESAHSTLSNDDNLQRTKPQVRLWTTFLYILLTLLACHFLQRLPDSSYPKHQVHDVNSLKPADVICFQRSTITGQTMYWHYAIIEHVDYVNKEIGVIEYQSDKRPLRISVKRTILNVFDKPVWRVEVNPSESLPTEKVLERATANIGIEEYNLFLNNCETFAMWCKTGSGFSSQVRLIMTVIGRAMATIAYGSTKLLYYISAN